MKLKLIVIGRDKHDPLVIAANEYLARLEKSFPVSVVELKEEPARSSTPVARIKSREAEKIREAIGPGDRVIALDERGQELSSAALADKLSRFSMEGRTFCFVIGGPEGLDADFLSSAHERWALSKMTLPHRMARLLLSEQLYRAASILRGEPYHR